MKKKNESIKSFLKDQIIAHFVGNHNQPYNYKQVANAIGSHDSEAKKFIQGILHALTKENVLVEAYKGKFKLNPAYKEKHKKQSPFIIGRVDMKQTKKAYIITDDLLEDVRIAPGHTSQAIHEDLVKVRLFPRRKDRKLEGEIVEVLERKNKTWVGVLQLHKNHGFVVADSTSMPFDIFVPAESIGNAKDGQKVIVEITDWPKRDKNPRGKVTEVLGNPGENEVEMHAILTQYNLPYKFEPIVEKEAEKIPTDISPEEIARREDFRDTLTITIDPHDAKDLDDALSFKKLKEDTYEVGVHIADVTHYVKPNSIIEQEAAKRATSIYLVDRVVPMLPEVLSNNVCSLNPNTDKLCYSVIFEITGSGKILKSRLAKTIINSNHRFSYEEAQKIIEEGTGTHSEAILALNCIASKIRKKRMCNGAIAFDKMEIKFHIDEKGKPTGVYLKEQKEANNLIEEFMLLANKMVAERTGKAPRGKTPKTFVYRTHDIPNPEKLGQLSEFVSKLGYKLKTDTRKNISSSLNKLLTDSKGKGEENLIETLTLRSMAKAEYSTQNIGHYGLAFDYYSHFTSPIRRYPDMMAHRLLFDYSNGKPSGNPQKYEDLCIHSSDMERKAQLAERDSVKFKQVEFMSDKIGEEFEGLISGVSKWGLFVEIKENKIEGLVRMADLNDDYYYLDEEHFQIIGYNKRIIYKLGDSIKIKIKSTDIVKKQLNFELAG